MKNHKKHSKMQTIACLAGAMLLLLLGRVGTAAENGWTPLGADDNFGVWHQPTGDWYVAGDAMVDPDNSRRLAGKPGTGVMINGEIGKTRSLVTKQPFDDVELHLEFMVAKGSNSGVIFHGNHEIQILDSHGIEKPTAGHCGGIYPRAETKPTYHHIDEGSPPRVNAAKPPGEWQTLDIIFQAARFDNAGTKTAHAKFVKVVHNGQVIQENHEVPWASGPNWDRKQFPRGPIIFQGDYGPIAYRNIRVRPWNGNDEDVNVPQEAVKSSKLNVPPKGFTALFNGKDFTGWRVHPKVKEMWSIEDGVLKAHGLLEQWGADLVTEKEYRDYVLMVDFRMPAQSDSGIHFRDLAPEMIGKFGDAEQFNIRSKGGMGHLESFRFLPENMKLTKEQLPQVKYLDPEIGVWHTVKLTLVGKNLTAELDGEVILDRFEYPEGILSMKPSAIRFQKHRFTDGDKPGEKNPCPIEYRNIFIKEIKPSESVESSGLNVPPEGFTALFNGKDLTGWHTPPVVKEYWSIEDGVLKSPGLLRQWGACLATKKRYRDFILMLDFRMPTISDSGINFRRLIPEIKGFGDMEQFNLRSKGGMGHLESYYFLPKQVAEKVGLKEEEKPHLRHIDPEVGVWHTVKLTMKGRTFSAEYDGEVLHDNFEYHDWMMNMEPAPIRLQKHIFVDGDNLGKENPCPIEYRNIFIKEVEPGTVEKISSRIKRLGDVKVMGPEKCAEGSKAENPNLPKQKKNVLFIAVDDLNDWVGCLGGHPQAKTPNIDRLAEKGVLFEQAYCAAPLCNPSRTAIMTGLNPSTTGIYGNKAWFRDIPKYKDWETIPQYFRKHGYMAWTGGKIYHQPDGKWSDPIAWDKQYSRKMGTPGPPPERRLQHGMSGKFAIDYYNTWLDWAPIDQRDEETDDWRTADLAAQFLQQEHDEPFFLGCGIFRPHLTWYIPKKYFDMHPIEDIQLPPHIETDLDDVPPMGRAMAGNVFKIIKKHGQWKNSVQGYLAACSFADACVGHVLNALEKSSYRDNTIVVLWGDHGYHLGEKDHFSKSALWEETSRTPLIIYAPGVPKSQGRCQRPVSLVDIYPTLIELCGLPRRNDLDGRSLAPLVRNPERDWPYPALITHSPYWHGTNHAIHSQRYHYIHYRDGGEELYDNTADPYGWKNLADDPKYAEAKEKLKKWLPKVNAEHFRPKALGNR